MSDTFSCEILIPNCRDRDSLHRVVEKLNAVARANIEDFGSAHGLIVGEAQLLDVEEIMSRWPPTGVPSRHVVAGIPFEGIPATNLYMHFSPLTWHALLVKFWFGLPSDLFVLLSVSQAIVAGTVTDVEEERLNGERMPRLHSRTTEANDFFYQESKKSSWPVNRECLQRMFDSCKTLRVDGIVSSQTSLP